MISKSAFQLSVKSVQRIIVGVSLFTVVFSAGYGLGVTGYAANNPLVRNVVIDRTSQGEQSDLNFSLFWKIWETLTSQYFQPDKIIPEQMVYGAIRGMVASLNDPYTIFLTPQQNKVVQEDLQGSFDGIGIQIGYIGAQLAVIAPLPQSPAEKAGILAGDLILSIKDISKEIEFDTNTISLPEAVQLIRGKSGTAVGLLIYREGESEPREFQIMRDVIDVPSVTLEIIDDNIAHIQVHKFSAETKTEWNNVVFEIQKNDKVKGIILDLRNNPGGYMQGSVDLASDFLDVNEIVVIEETKTTTTEYKTESIPRLKNYKLVLLANKGSASASEILIGALRDNLASQFVGERTFGKGTIQEPQRLDGGEGLHLTIARWITPNKTWVNDTEGLVPDVEVINNPETPQDEQLEKAKELLRELIFAN